VVSGQQADPTSPRLDPLHAMQFRAPQIVQVTGMCPASRPPPIDRDCPPETARDRCLWHAGGTAGKNNRSPTWRRRLQRSQRVRPSQVTTTSLAEPEGLAPALIMQPS
jgi:hypothetical protein